MTKQRAEDDRGHTEWVSSFDAKRDDTGEVETIDHFERLQDVRTFGGSEKVKLLSYLKTRDGAAVRRVEKGKYESDFIDPMVGTVKLASSDPAAP